MQAKRCSSSSSFHPFNLPLLWQLITISTFLIGTVHDATAQVKPQSIVQLAPEAAEFAKYGTYPVGTATGTPSINIPVYEINTGKLKVPISLSYHASGIRVKQRATWIGLGWSLNAGGVISRAVRGLPDEGNHNRPGWISDTRSTDEIESSQDVSLIANYADNMRDLQPDFFTYNLPGKAGKFIYSKDLQAFVPIEYDKIQITLNGGFFITDSDGTRYHFNQKQNYWGEEPEPPIPNNYPSSWYLTKIVSFDKTDSIMFSYATGANGVGATESPDVVETHTRKYEWLHEIDQPNGWQIRPIISSITYVYTGFVQLKEINYAQGRIIFSANTPRLDAAGAALDEMVVQSKKPDGSFKDVAKFNFSHDYFSTPSPISPYHYRLRLLSFVRKDLTGTEDEVYSFQYNAQDVPSVNSYSADYWGFYNGANNGIAGSYLPNVAPTHPQLVSVPGIGTVGGSDRNPSDTHIMAGMLEKITYPTKGYTVFSFEPHKYKSDIVRNTQVTRPIKSATVVGKGRNILATTTQTFQWPTDAISNTGKLIITFTANTNPGAFDVPQRVTLKDLTTGVTVRTWEHTGNNAVPQTIEDGYLFVPGRSYQLFCLVDDVNTTRSSIDVYGDFLITETSQIIRSGGGIRIKSVSSFNADGSFKQKEEYQYSSPEGDGLGIMLRTDLDFTTNYVERQVQYVEPDCYWDGTPCPCLVSRDEINYSASASYSHITFEGSPVLYDRITRIQVDASGVPNGKTAYYYRAILETSTAYNPSIPGHRDILDNSLTANGLLIAERTYKYTEGAFNLVREKTFNHDLYNFRTESCINIWRKLYHDEGWTCHTDYLSDFGSMRYTLKFGALKGSEITIKDYLENGTTVTSSSTTYGNTTHLLPTETIVTDSNGDTFTERISYVGDHLPSDANKTVLDKLVLLNRYQPFLIEKFKNSDLLTSTRTIFANDWNTNSDLVQEKEQHYIINNEGLSIDADMVETKLVDYLGHPLWTSSKKGPDISYIWDYYNTYPIAQIVGAPHTEVAHSSFEGDGTGNLTFTQSVSTTDAVTGTASHNLSSSSITRNGLTPSKRYKVSYWYKSGTVSLSVVPIAGTTITRINSYTGWTYQEQVIIGSASLVISGTALLDEVRIFPEEAQMTTYTFLPLIGMTSICDSNGIIKYFEFDGLGRLKCVRDQDKNITQHYRYHFSNR